MNQLQFPVRLQFQNMSLNLVSKVENNHCVSSVNLSDVSLSHLDEDQQVQLREPLMCFAEVFSDVPGKMNVVKNNDTGMMLRV